MKRIFSFILFLILISCSSPEQETLSNSIFPNANYGAVVSAHPLATEVGMKILESGGNAFDAAIAVHMSLAVVYPRAGNIGGGGFMVYHTKNNINGSLDFREKAPLFSSRDMYLDSLGNPLMEESRIGALSVGVPGSVAGMAAIYEKFGSLEWEELIAPSIEQAEIGFALTKREAEVFNRYAIELLKYNGSDFYLVKEGTWKKGDLVKAPQLAKTLKLISENGKDGFYKGEVAEAFIKTMKENNGIINLQDLLDYDVKWRDPIKFDFKEYKVISMPLPSSGGIALAQLLYGIDKFQGDTLSLNSSAFIHLNTELERRVFADRAEYLGDEDFVEVPVDLLTDTAYLNTRFRGIDPNNATPSSAIKLGELKTTESLETTHLSIIDRWGNAVSITTTLNGNFGSKLACKEGGFLLNNEMDDFSIKPGVANQFGLIGNEANSIEANKRMLSSMTPTIVLKDDNPILVLGSPGGSRIITSVYQTILNTLIYDLPIQEAVNETKFHSQWLPDQIYYEEGRVDSLLLDSLKIMGHQVIGKSRLGKMKVIRVRKGILEAAGDTLRGDDNATVR